MATVKLIDNENSTNPAFNLAFEEFILRTMDVSSDYLMICRNQPSIIIGKHQNPFREANHKVARERNIPVFRRISGGGTVYHDPGNINFSFITRYTPHHFNNYFKFVTPVVDLLNDLGVPAILNGRNDIIIHGMKISGNAQFTSRKKLLCHGTLLFNTDLDLLKSVLHAEHPDIYSKSTPSVRSPVTNLEYFLSPRYSIDDFRKILTERLLGEYNAAETLHLSQEQQICLEREYVRKFSSWEWNYGRTPRFRIQGKLGSVQVEFYVEEGMIRQVNQEPESRKWTIARMNLVGMPFMPQTFETLPGKIPGFDENDISNIMNVFF